jgi:rubrerythrin
MVCGDPMPMTKTQSKTSRRSRTSGRGQSTTKRSGSKRPSIKTASIVLPNEMQVEELLLQALETELGGVQVYETALRCAQDDDLREEWQEYHEQTQRHVEIVQELCQQVGIDTEKETPGRKVVRHLGESLVEAMEMALKEAPGDAAQLVACECVTLAETKDHQNWSLIGELCDAFDKADDDRCDAFEAAYDEVEDEEDEHLYHTMGWCRELWIQGLGLPAAIPPPEEEKDVKSMAQAARAKGNRKSQVKRSR